MAEAPTTARWRMPWLGWVTIVLVVLTTTFLFWFTSERDLVAADARMRGLGIVPGWAELGLKASPAPRLDDWRRLGQLATAIVSYQDAVNWRPVPGQALPDQLVQHHRRLPAGDLATLLNLCDGLPPEGLVTRTSATHDTLMPELMWMRGLCRLGAERIRLAPPESAVAESRRLLAVIAGQQANTMIQRLVSMTCLAIWQQAVASRLQDEGLDREALAAQADAARIWLAGSMAGAMDDELRIWRDTFVAVHRGEAKTSRAFEADIGVDGDMRGFGIGRVLARAGRGAALELLIDTAQVWHAAPDHRGRQAGIRAIEASVGAGWSITRRLAVQLISPVGMINDSWLKCDTGLAVLAAELRRAPWPIDPSDPAGGQVRRIERAGRLIGYYLLGSNQADDGGRIKGDFCQALYERLGETLAADPPRDP